MKKLLLLPLILLACQPEKTNPLEGTWQLVTGTIVENGNTTITQYGQDKSFIKVINKTHFTFLLHDLGKDSTKLFAAGGGRYELEGNNYTEHLEYCSDRAWEGHDFPFTIQISGDTLVQSGGVMYHMMQKETKRSSIPLQQDCPPTRC
jgi:hypothetical protein